MQKKSLQLCGFALILGIFGAFLRWVQSRRVFEADTGLATPHSIWSYAVILIILLSAALIYFWVRSLKKNSFPQSYPAVFSRSEKAYSVSSVVIGIIMAVGGLMAIFSAMTEKSSYSTFQLMLGFLAVLCAICVTAFVLNAMKRDKQSSGTLNAAIVVLFLCFWLIAAYKYSASDPVIWHFAPRLLAISATILAFYFMAGFVYGRPKALSSLFFSLFGSFLCILTLADSYPMGEQLIVLAFAAEMLLLSFAQLNNMTVNGSVTETE
jgi:hypothetical protein